MDAVLFLRLAFFSLIPLFPFQKEHFPHLIEVWKAQENPLFKQYFWLHVFCNYICFKCCSTKLVISWGHFPWF